MRNFGDKAWSATFRLIALFYVCYVTAMLWVIYTLGMAVITK